MSLIRPSHILSSYYAPRGHHRMYALGAELAQLYLAPTDKLIGIIGDAGSGKSALIRGMFPGLDLTNDDNGVYIRPLPILDINDSPFSFFTPHTYHLDIRFENGFTQMSELADAIADALHKGKRVVVEHFDLVYPLLGANANLLIGVGEQILISRPSLFGPEPDEIKQAVYQSLRYRLMAHTAEDICEMFINEHDLKRAVHGDVRHGFSLIYNEDKPEIDLLELERKVNEVIAADLPVTYVDDSHITIGDSLQECDGPRVHVHRTGQIENFRLMHHFIYDKFKRNYVLVGCVGEHSDTLLKALDQRRQRPGWQ
ncbi:MAG: alanine-tRNA synthetase second additional domain-containing protein [Ruminococcaceae bacterium]|nr:alanine-tRNA synthetase second additional domain-containing protein [Oscillospiraceae bacterium]